MTPSIGPCFWGHDVLPARACFECDLRTEPLFVLSRQIIKVVYDIDNVHSVDILDFFKVDCIIPVTVGVLLRSDKVCAVGVAEHQVSKGVLWARFDIHNEAVCGRLQNSVRLDF